MASATKQSELVDEFDSGKGSRFQARSPEGRRAQVVVGKDRKERSQVISTYSTAIRGYRKQTEAG